MIGLGDRSYLRSEQYRDSANLGTRIDLHQRFSTNPYGWHRWAFDQLELPGRARLLELGCGPGHLWRENGERIRPGWELILSDFSPGMVREARSCVAHQQLRGIVADAQELCWPAATFDAVIANHMLYHVPDRQRAFAEIRRVLRPGGRLYAATNGAEHLRQLKELAQRCDPSLAFKEIPFTLENGREQMANRFSAIELRHYQDSLFVTESEALVEYLRSGPSGSLLIGAKLEQLVADIERRMEHEGGLRIYKSVGLFIAVR